MFSAVQSSLSPSCSTVLFNGGCYTDVKAPKPRTSSIGFDLQEGEHTSRCMATFSPPPTLPRISSVSLLSKLIKDSPSATPNSSRGPSESEISFSRPRESEATNPRMHKTSPNIPIPTETYLRDPKAIEERLKYHNARITLREQMEDSCSTKQCAAPSNVAAC